MESEASASAIKFMNQDMVRLDRFDGTNFTRWQDKLNCVKNISKVTAAHSFTISLVSN